MMLRVATNAVGKKVTLYMRVIHVLSIRWGCLTHTTWLVFFDTKINKLIVAMPISKYLSTWTRGGATFTGTEAHTIERTHPSGRGGGGGGLAQHNTIVASMRKNGRGLLPSAWSITRRIHPMGKVA